MNLLAARLKNARKAKGYTQRELATLADMDQAHISRLENGGRSISMEHLQALAKVLGVSVSHLLGEDVKNTSSDDKATGIRAALLANHETPDGLRQLAADTTLADALRITEAEWKALDSIQLPGEVNKDGYVQLLITIRAVS